jgi:tryptophan 2,3-dioxygenase
MATAARTYADFLELDKILNAQVRFKGAHDELLFVVIHQAAELWMKVMLHELGAAIAIIREAEDLRPAFKMLARVGRIQAQLTQSWDVLATMTPGEFLAFRDALGTSSGFQSYQYREIEFTLGQKNRAMLAMHGEDARVIARLTAALERPSLYDEAIRLLARRGFAIDPAQASRDWAEPYRPHASVEQAWLAVYRDPTTHWDLYELGEELVDLEDSFQQWRFRHVTTVERVIGSKPGTGGSPGVSYLRKVLDHRFFPELWSMRSVM